VHDLPYGELDGWFSYARGWQMKLSRSVTYAVRALLEMAQKDGEEPLRGNQLAAVGGMPPKFLQQILRTLVVRGILRSSRGPDGGYTFSRSIRDISLLEVIEAIDGPYATADSLLDEGLPCPPELKKVVEDVTAATRTQLASVKLGDLRPVAGSSALAGAVVPVLEESTPD
jgi:Rrf2 family protein